MTEPAASALPSQSAEFIRVWSEAFAQVLEQVTGSATSCAVMPEAPSDLPPGAASDLWILCACSGGLRGEMSFRLPAASVLRLAQILMSEPPAPEVELTSDHREAALELFRQVGGHVATELKATWTEVQIHLDTSPGAPSWPASSTMFLRAGNDPAAPIAELHLSAALMAALRAEKADPVKGATSPASPVAPSPEQGQVKLDLLMDVELAVTLRFGSRRLLLREVLDLIPGAVVDLDRQVEEPVDVLLDGRLVARGEVVVLDGNYGVRVTEVAPVNL